MNYLKLIDKYIENNDWNKFNKIIPNINLSEITDGKSNPLITAIRFLRLEMIKILLKNGIDPSLEDSYSFIVATSSGNLDIVKLLLTDHRVKVNCMDDFPVYNAAIKRNNEVLKFLLTLPKVNPTDKDNVIIRSIFDFDFKDTFKILWNDERIKNSVKEYDSSFYQELVNYDIKNKLTEF